MPHWETICTSHKCYLASIVIESRIYILSKAYTIPKNKKKGNLRTILILHMLDSAENPDRLLEISRTVLHDRKVDIDWCIAASCEGEIHFLLRCYISRLDARRQDQLVTYNTATKKFSHMTTTGAAPPVDGGGNGIGCQVGQDIFLFYREDDFFVAKERVYCLNLRNKQWSLRKVRGINWIYHSENFRISQWNNFLVLLSETEDDGPSDGGYGAYKVSLFDTTNNKWRDSHYFYNDGPGYYVQEVRIMQTVTYENKLIIIGYRDNDFPEYVITSFDLDLHTWNTVACHNMPQASEDNLIWKSLLHNHLIYVFTYNSSCCDGMTIRVLNMKSRSLNEQCKAAMHNNARELRSLPSVINIGDVRGFDKIQ